MIKALRKRHVQIWSILLLVIPVGTISSWLSVRKVKTDQLLQPVVRQAFPHIISSIERDDYTIRLRSNSSSVQQIEWINKTVLAVPTAVIYKVGDGNVNLDSCELVGRVDAKGKYYFPVKQVSSEKLKFILYDFLHKQIIDTINFQR
jgi:hypothetical protein